MKSIGGLLVLALSFAAARLTVDNGGTVAAVAGATRAGVRRVFLRKTRPCAIIQGGGFAIVAADTRLSEGYTIRSGNISRITRVGSRSEGRAAWLRS